MKRKLWIVVIALVILAGWRHWALNKSYQSLFPDSEIKQFPMREWVPFEKDFLDYGSSAEGYSLRADSLELISTEEAKERWGVDPDQEIGAGERMAVVTVTLKGQSEETGVMLTDLLLHTGDVNAMMNWDLLVAANPVLAGNYGILLPEERELELYLPFSLTAVLFRKSTWDHMERETFYLKLTSYPTVKEIVIPGTA